MALFQSSVLKDHLRLQEKMQVDEAYLKFTSFFHNPEIQENIRSSKEEQFQATFLRELFVDVLGYTMNPQPGYELTTEFKNQKNARKADGAILKDGVAVAVIELKGTNTKHLEGIRQQAFDYKANQKGCVYVITSNFEKLRFYINDATEFEEFDLFELNREDFSLLYLCLHKDNIYSNRPLKIKEASIVEEEVITKQFYKDYSVFKRELFRDLVLRNVDRIKNENHIARHPENPIERHPELVSGSSPQPETKKQIRLNLFKKSQKLIDRFLFIFFAEDRGLLPPNSIHRILADWDKLKDLDAVIPLYDRFKLYFGFLDTGRKGTDKKAEIFAYNGGLFKPDPILDTIEIDDELLYKHASKLATYDFESQVDVNILGHIFENSLNEIESVSAEIEGGEFDKQKSKRKKDGVFYTPKYITKYIVENTVGRLCEEKKSELGFREEEYYRGRKQRQAKTVKDLIRILDDYRDWLLKLTICDPACGSGAFLNQALDFLIREHQYIDEMKAKLLGGSLLFSDIETTILENNIYGVDINEESVEIAKLSLWLRTAQPRRKLNDLSSNIKCGNSLIDDKAVAGNKAFKWEEEFPEIFAKGGFDVVIGNPPWGAKISSEQKDYIINKFLCKNGQVETYVHFIDLAINFLTNNKGYTSFITPNTWFYLDKYFALRENLIKKEIFSLVELEKRIFIDAPDIVPGIFVIKNYEIKENNVHCFKLKKGKIPQFLIQQDLFHSYTIAKGDWKQFESLSFNLALDTKKTKILLKMQHNSEKLSSKYNVRYGIKTGNNKKFIKKTTSSDLDSANWKYCLPSASTVKRYSIVWEGDILNYCSELSGFSTNSFERPKILIQYIRKLSMERRLVTALDTGGKFYPLNNFSFVEGKLESWNLDFLLGVLNSTLMNFYFSNVHIDYNIKPKYIEKLPLPILEKEFLDLSMKTNSITEIKKELNFLLVKIGKYLNSQYHLLNLSKKLQSWHELDFGIFIKELNKAIQANNKERAKEGLSPVPELTKKDEFEWMELFEEKKKKAQELQREIEKTDAEIDRMVYELYGLTEEEIAIVENS